MHLSSFSRPALDISYKILNNLVSDVDRVCASVSSLPFQDKSFDVVMATELLEHLNDNVLYNAIAEITRVARLCVVISVPFDQFLPAGFIKCSDCNTIYHLEHHYQSFNEIRLRNLFKPMLNNIEISYLEGRKRFNFVVPFLVKLLHSVNRYELSSNPWARCPNCGSKRQHYEPRNLVTITVAVTNAILKLFAFGKKRIGAVALLYMRNG